MLILHLMKFSNLAPLLLGICFFSSASAQRYDYVQKGEFGLTVGAAHYFGDLNNRVAINRPKPAVGIYFLKQFGNYIGLRVSAHYAELGYSDTYSKNDYQRLRNLSFNTSMWEVAVQGQFNFFKFVPNEAEHLFTPFITIGAGVFTYDPYAYLDGQKQYLRRLGTEGQNIGYNGRKPYNTMAFCFPVGVGIKYNISERLNFLFEITQRFTTTDYLDDVSTTYVGKFRFSNLPSGDPSPAKLLQDRSYEVIPGYEFTEGQQRGWSKQKDQYIIAEVGLSLNIGNTRCPSTR